MPSYFQALAGPICGGGGGGGGEAGEGKVLDGVAKAPQTIRKTVQILSKTLLASAHKGDQKKFFVAKLGARCLCLTACVDSEP